MRKFLVLGLLLFSTPVWAQGQPSAGNVQIGQGAALPRWLPVTQDCSLALTGVITCTKTNNVAFAASATTDTTSATNISSGTLNTARLPSPFTNGTRSGIGTIFMTGTGTFTNGHIPAFNANGDIVDAYTKQGSTTVLATVSGVPTSGTIPTFNASGDLLATYTHQGISTVLISTTGATTNGHFASYNTNGDIQDSGVAISTTTQTIASGAKALATGAIGSGTCTAAQTDTATGTATTDVIETTFNADVSGVTGYSPSINGMLTILVYPTANTVNFKVCNNTLASITPGAVTMNWRVVR